jgi:predicted O-methyltransferase YrrM
LLDVDLYRPMAKALPELWEVLSPGGIMVVDDCNPDDVLWDGSDQAYKEFVATRGLAAEVVHGKLGLVRKPRTGVAGP